MGAAVDYTPLITEPTYAQTLGREFDYVTPGNALKWGSVQPVDPDHWDFTQGDGIVAAAEANHQRIKGHNLVWHQQLPPFVTTALTASQLVTYMTNNIRKEVGRYRGRMYAWDVVNEAIADDGSGLRVDVFSSLLGSGFIATAFREAHHADPFARLYYNDYGTETINAKSNAVFALVQGLIAQHVPIDGVGFQFHVDAATAPSTEDIVANLRRFTELGVSVNISELDVKVASLTSTEAERRASQRQVFHRVVAACRQVHGCEAITTWGFTDKYSWLAPDETLEFDSVYQRKPGYYGIFDGLVGIAPDAMGTAPNLIANSTFESGGDGWSATGDRLDVTFARAHTGDASARLHDRTSATQGVTYDLSALVTRGHGYDVSAWARIHNAHDAPVTVGAKVTCANSSEIDVAIATQTATRTAWTTINGSLNIPDCTIVRASLYISGPPAAVDLFVDDISVRPQPEPRGPNLVTNPDFESGTAGWYTWSGTLTASTAQAHGGAQSALVTARTATWNGPVYSLTSSVIPGATYAASGWVRLADAATDTADIAVKITCSGAGDSYQQLASTTVTDTGWVQLAGTITIPVCPLVDVELYVEGPAVGESIYLDDVAVQQLLWHTVSANVISNSDFESSAAGWAAFGGTLSVSATFAHGGLQSGVSTGRTAAWNGPSYAMPIWPARYAVSAWVLQDGTSTETLALTSKLTCNNTTNYADVVTVSAAPNTWVELAGTLVVPAGCTDALIYVQQESGTDLPNIYIDDVTALFQPLTNIITNSDFESGGSGWAAFGGTFNVSSSFAHAGTHSGADTGRTASYMGPSYTIPAGPATYTVTAWALQDGTSSIQLVLNGRLECGANTTYPYIAGATVAQDTWVVLTGTLTVPSGCTNALIYLNQGTGTTFPDLYIDDVTADE
jgi:endo-1,4-beta-xylanase